MPTHFITTPMQGVWFLTYNARMTASEVKRNWEEYRQKSTMIEPLLTYGFGDGGGGPTEQMLHVAARLSRGPAIESMPQVKHEKASSLMQRIIDRQSELPIWDGELYLELHRGTYTTQGWLKRANRKNEIALHNVEWLTCLIGDAHNLFDKSTLDQLWQNLLLLQFHDILPGSSISEVYDDDARPMHQHIADQTSQLIDKAAQALANEIDTSPFASPVVLFNTLSWDRQDPIQLPDDSWRDDVTVPAGGWTVIDANEASTAPATLSVNDNANQLQNEFWNITLDESGCISSLIDRRADRDILQPGQCANQWQIFEDRPIDYEAWDIDDSYRQFPLASPKLIERRIVEQSPCRVAIAQRWVIPDSNHDSPSTITQTLAIYAHHPRIDFETTIDWHEHHQLLKVAFPVDLRAIEATYEIQFGHLKRPTHRNTSWDVARFECCAHRFVDLSEHGYGVALLNDCKYGHDILDGVIRLTCLKSPQSPAASADQGEHVFTYALLPHTDSFQSAGVIHAAAELNTPMVVHQTTASPGKRPANFTPVRSDHDAVIIDTLKPAEDGCGYIMRLYESHGSHATINLHFADLPQQVILCNLLETPLKEDVRLGLIGNKLALSLKPFQIVTLRVQ